MAVDMFLKIDGIEGESRDHKHAGEIEVLSFSWGVSNSGRATGGGGGAGKVTIHDFSIVKYLDKSSPQLFEKCCQGEHLQDVNLTLVRKAGGSQQEYFKIKLTDVLVSSVQPGGSVGGGATTLEQVSFNFSSVHISAADQKGNFVSNVSCSGEFRGDIANDAGHH